MKNKKCSNCGRIGKTSMGDFKCSFCGRWYNGQTKRFVSYGRYNAYRDPNKTYGGNELPSYSTVQWRKAQIDYAKNRYYTKKNRKNFNKNR